jgi:hypothetical protein
MFIGVLCASESYHTDSEYAVTVNVWNCKNNEKIVLSFQVVQQLARVKLWDTLAWYVEPDPPQLFLQTFCVQLIQELSLYIPSLTWYSVVTTFWVQSLNHTKFYICIELGMEKCALQIYTLESHFQVSQCMIFPHFRFIFYGTSQTPTICYV